MLSAHAPLSVFATALLPSPLGALVARAACKTAGSSSVPAGSVAARRAVQRGPWSALCAHAAAPVAAGN
eukprot:11863766-Alexandrium_andersonii.AAC.1